MAPDGGLGGLLGEPPACAAAAVPPSSAPGLEPLLGEPYVLPLGLLSSADALDALLGEEAAVAAALLGLLRGESTGGRGGLLGDLHRSPEAARLPGELLGVAPASADGARPRGSAVALAARTGEPRLADELRAGESAVPLRAEQGSHWDRPCMPRMQVALPAAAHEQAGRCRSGDAAPDVSSRL